MLTRKTALPASVVVRSGWKTRRPPQTHEQGRRFSRSQPRDGPWLMPKLNRGRRRSCYRRCRPRAQKRHAFGCSCSKRNVWQRSSQQPRLAATLALVRRCMVARHDGGMALLLSELDALAASLA